MVHPHETPGKTSQWLTTAFSNFSTFAAANWASSSLEKIGAMKNEPSPTDKNMGEARGFETGIFKFAILRESSMQMYGSLWDFVPLIVPCLDW